MIDFGFGTLRLRMPWPVWAKVDAATAALPHTSQRFSPIPRLDPEATAPIPEEASR